MIYERYFDEQIPAYYDFFKAHKLRIVQRSVRNMLHVNRQVYREAWDYYNEFFYGGSATTFLVNLDHFTRMPTADLA